MCTCIRKYFGGFGRNSESKSVFALSICIKGILTYSTDQTLSYTFQLTPGLVGAWSGRLFFIFKFAFALRLLGVC